MSGVRRYPYVCEAECESPDHIRNVIYDGGYSVTDRGVCWGTSANPTTSNTCTKDGKGTGAFTSSITGLTASTNYHIRAYATSAMGTAYGADADFMTLGPPDFQINTGSGGSYSATVNAGSSAFYDLAVTGVNNFSGSVTFSCSGLPAGASCSASPATLLVSGSAAVPFTVTITTTARTASAPNVMFPRSGPAGTGVALCFVGLTLLLSIPKRRRISIAFVLLCVAGLAGCGRSTAQGTPAGTYSVVLAAKSGSISRSANLTLTVR